MNSMLANSDHDRVIVRVTATIWVILLDGSENDDVGRFVRWIYENVKDSRIYTGWNVLSIVFLSDTRTVIDYPLVLFNRLEHACLLWASIQRKR